MKTHEMITVGITSRFASPSLVSTCTSIRQCLGFEKGRIILVNDHTPLQKEQLESFRLLNVEVYENPKEGSIQSKMEQILALVKTPYVLFTQDDVKFSPNLLNKLAEKLSEDEGITLLAVKNQALPGKSVVGKALVTGMHFTDIIVKKWNDGDNYLACVGRAMVCKCDFLREKFVIDPWVLATDAQFYFENKKLLGKFVYFDDEQIFFRCAEKLKEHRRKSSRFQYLHMELEKTGRYPNFASELLVPKDLTIKALVTTFIKEPFSMSVYLIIWAYTRLFPLKTSEVMTQLWNAETSTQKI